MTKWLIGSVAAAALVASPLVFAGGEGCSKNKAQCAKAQAVAAVAGVQADTAQCTKGACWIKFPAKAAEGVTLASVTSKLEALGTVDEVGSCNKSQALYVKIKPGETLKMSEVLAALDGSGVSVDRAQVALPKSSNVHATISGMSCGACANKVQGSIASLPTIEKAKVEVGFANFTVKDDMTYAALAKGVENGKFKIEDLSWTAPKPVIADASAAASKGQCPYADKADCDGGPCPHAHADKASMTSAKAGGCPYADKASCEAAKAAGKTGACCDKGKSNPDA